MYRTSDVPKLSLNSYPNLFLRFFVLTSVIMFDFKTTLNVLVLIWAFDSNFVLAQAEDAKPKTGGSFEAEIRLSQVL